MKTTNLFKIGFFILFFSFSKCIFGEEVVKETFVYGKYKGEELKLDRYSIKSNQKSPAVIFMFGGSFSSGKRDADDYLLYFQTLAQNGIQVFSIDYHLGMKKTEGKASDNSLRSFVISLHQTINIATENLFDATNYILTNTENWNIDKNLIIASGSSAGGISVLHGELALANETKISEKVPPNFRYAGIISFAGAIFSVEGKPKWNQKPAPMLLFHGNSDERVPYNKLKIAKVGLFGSNFIAKQLDEMRVPYYFYDEEYGTHRIAESPMKEQLPLILDFIHKDIIEKQQISTHIKTSFTQREKRKTKFKITDYLKKMR